MARLVKRSLAIAGHRTSVALEQEFWDVLDQLAEAEGTSLPTLIQRLDQERSEGLRDAGNLASILRVHALQQVRRGRFGRPLG